MRNLLLNFTYRLHGEMRGTAELFLKFIRKYRSNSQASNFFSPQTGTSDHQGFQNTKVVNYVLSGRALRKDLKCSNENNYCLERLGILASEVVCEDKTLESGP